MRNILFKTIGLSCLMFLGACASTMNSTDPSEYDPLESMNRHVYSFNKAVDKGVITPVVKAYKKVVPKPPRDGISNAMRNLREPWVFLNDILQLKFKRAGTTLARFVINSTAGIGGLFKASDDIGLKYHSEDFGQTLAVWGLGDGPYLVLPFIGPSNGRDLSGLATEFFYDPVTYTLDKTDHGTLSLTRTGVDVFDARARLDLTLTELYKDPDGYVLMRSAYRQYRRNEIYDGNPPSQDDDIFDDLEDEGY